MNQLACVHRATCQIAKICSFVVKVISRRGCVLFWGKGWGNKLRFSYRCIDTTPTFLCDFGGSPNEQWDLIHDKTSWQTKTNDKNLPHSQNKENIVISEKTQMIKLLWALALSMNVLWVEQKVIWKSIGKYMPSKLKLLQHLRIKTLITIQTGIPRNTDRWRLLWSFNRNLLE